MQVIPGCFGFPGLHIIWHVNALLLVVCQIASLIRRRHFFRLREKPRQKRRIIERRCPAFMAHTGKFDVIRICSRGIKRLISLSAAYRRNLFILFSVENHKFHIFGCRKALRIHRSAYRYSRHEYFRITAHQIIRGYATHRDTYYIYPVPVNRVIGHQLLNQPHHELFRF